MTAATERIEDAAAKMQESLEDAMCALAAIQKNLTAIRSELAALQNRSVIYVRTTED